ncbi:MULTISPECIES: phosphopantetheine-binding protein [Chryseobacterium group]|uniref:phosphopantetheine-binding protein n=1 Tax=Chryseobacterium group TaxID=2782232 RepID=UPI0012A7EC6F|nr:MULTISPECIES: phosphopantetheine-binding protein [Chryseobacterium group]MDF0718971.1 phosphopantetheine-binding protein [Kaistella sp. PBT33-4]QFG54147.1 acyl carrier protein [Chryseobacterium sp.]
MMDLREELKHKIIEVLNLEDVSAEEIANDAPLFGGGLGLDSIDALELIVLLDKQYGIKLADPKKGKEIFESIDTMATYIEQHRTK